MITLGSDSEFNLAKYGRPVSALRVLDDKVTEVHTGRFFADNMNVEIAINPVESLAQWHSYTEDLLARVGDLGYDLEFNPVVEYDAADLDHPLALISGCNPDFTGYRPGVSNKAPDFATMEGATRSCGAHVHTGDPTIDPDNQAMWMDLHLTLPLLQFEQVSNRRTMYGGPGCLRYKDYGMEYRTLSNVWLNDYALREFVYEASFKAMESARTMDFREIPDWKDIPRAIMSHDVEEATRILDRAYIYGVITI